MPVDNAEFAHLLHHHVDDLLTWLDDYPADQVDPTAMASVRRSLDWMIEQSPVEQGDRPASLRTATGLLIDLTWWLDTCEDEQVDPFVAVKLQESTGAWLDELTAGQRRRLVEVLGELAASEEHNARRYEIRFFAFALGLVDDEIEDEAPAVREWIRPEPARAASLRIATPWVDRSRWVTLATPAKTFDSGFVKFGGAFPYGREKLLARGDRQVQKLRARSPRFHHDVHLIPL